MIGDKIVWSTHNHKVNPGGQSWVVRRAGLMVVVVVAAGMAATMAYLYLMNGAQQSETYQAKKFEDRLKEVCAAPKLAMPEYRGVKSFFDYINEPDRDHCYSWVEFGGEKIPIPSQSERECSDEVRKTKYICFNEEYKMTHDPCLMYSFDKDADSQFERDINLFSCDIHAFDTEKVKTAEHVKLSEFWLEHAWTISEFPYDKPMENNQIERRRPLDYIIKVLGHEGKEIKFIKSDMEGREWILLRQIITHADTMDVKQLGMKLHIPLSVNQMSGEARHEYFAGLFKVFQGLSCAGYKYVLGRPVKYYKGIIKVPETGNSSFFPAYEVNWAKVIS